MKNMGIIIIILGAAEMIANLALAIASFVIVDSVIGGIAYLFNMLIGLVLIQVGVNSMKLSDIEKEKKDLEHRVRNLER